MILVVVLYALLASTFILAKKAVGFANPCFLIGFRMLIAGSLLLGYQFLFQRSRFGIKRGDWWLFIKVSLFHIYFAFILDLWSLQYITSLKATLIYSTTPFIAAVLSYFLVNERLSRQKLLGIIIGFGSLLPVLLTSATGPEAAMEFATISLPEIVMLGSVLSATYAWFIVTELMAKGYSLIMINGIAMLFGGGLSMVTAITVEGVSNPVRDWPQFLFWVFLLIIVANIMVYNLYGWLLKRYSITFLTLAGFLSPSFGALYEWLFMSGEVTWYHGVSLVLVTLGLYVFYRDDIKIRFYPAPDSF